MYACTRLSLISLSFAAAQVHRCLCWRAKWKRKRKKRERPCSSSIDWLQCSWNRMPVKDDEDVARVSPPANFYLWPTKYKFLVLSVFVIDLVGQRIEIVYWRWWRESHKVIGRKAVSFWTVISWPMTLGTSCALTIISSFARGHAIRLPQRQALPLSSRQAITAGTFLLLFLLGLDSQIVITKWQFNWSSPNKKKIKKKSKGVPLLSYDWRLNALTCGDLCDGFLCAQHSIQRLMRHAHRTVTHKDVLKVLSFYLL